MLMGTCKRYIKGLDANPDSKAYWYDRKIKSLITNKSECSTFVSIHLKSNIMPTNYKDIISTICGIIIAICGAGTGLIWQLGVTLPSWVTPVAIALAGIAVIVLGFLQGKNPNLTSKTPRQVDNLNNEAAATKNIK
jgi:hypothetical protein